MEVRGGHGPGRRTWRELGETLGDDVMSTDWPRKSRRRQPETIMKKKLISYSARPNSRDVTPIVCQPTVCQKLQETCQDNVKTWRNCIHI